MNGIDSSGIRKVFNLAAQIKDPINLSIGQPDFDVPETVKKDMIAAINAGDNRYTLTQGTAALRNAIVKLPRYQRSSNTASYNDDNIIITSGVSGGIMLALAVLVNPGDAVMMADPYFVMYPHLTRFFGAAPAFIDTYPDFTITEEKLKAAYVPNAKVIIVNSPSNPTGVTLSEAEIKTIAAFAKKHNLIVLSDEIYDAFSYDGALASIADHYPDTIILNGYSKNLAMTGLRVGYAMGPKDIIAEMIKLQQYTFVCAPSIAQKGIERHVAYDFSANCDAYRKKRDIIYDGLKDAFHLVKPTGAFYAFPQFKHKESGDEFVKRAIEKKVLVIPANVFSQRNNGFRLSFAAENATLEKGIAVLRSLVP
ncbi:MAG: aminotransferase class I/II-fold pyridoxal phosphate-dependent enzyme [Spirochaetes bacterium]|nr:aminotransferase class I/II-fold pyridoxal phosphate-dependent enzyme [Spirochaetota bacterium]